MKIELVVRLGGLDIRVVDLPLPGPDFIRDLRSRMQPVCMGIVAEDEIASVLLTDHLCPVLLGRYGWDSDKEVTLSKDLVEGLAMAVREYVADALGRAE